MKKYLLGTALVAALAFGNVMAGGDYDDFKAKAFKYLDENIGNNEGIDVADALAKITVKIAPGNLGESFKDTGEGIEDLIKSLKKMDVNTALPALEALLIQDSFSADKSSIVTNKKTKWFFDNFDVYDNVDPKSWAPIKDKGVNAAVETLNLLAKIDKVDLKGFDLKKVITESLDQKYDIEIKNATSNQNKFLSHLINSADGRSQLVHQSYHATVMGQLWAGMSKAAKDSEKLINNIDKSHKGFVTVFNDITGRPYDVEIDARSHTIVEKVQKKK